MNFFALARYIGLLLVVFGLSMIPSLAWGIYYADGSAWPIFWAMTVTIAAGGLLALAARGRNLEIYRREANAIVGLSWILSSAFGALPFYFADFPEMASYTACFFETVSGLTTTGSSILTDIEAVPRGLLFWRSWTHWLGGLGIVLLFLAILPYIGAGGRALFRSEVAGPVKEGLTPRIRDTAFLLLKLYLGYTFVQTCLLLICGMTFFDALCHTFGTLATGGFSPKNTSIAAFDSLSVEIVIIVFMILSGTNFALMYRFFSGKSLNLFKDAEWRTWVLMIFAVVVFIAAILHRWGQHEYLSSAFRDAAFSVVSIATCTGFATADTNAWPAFAHFILLTLMFIGGCAGSTAGGLKMLRLVIIWKAAWLKLEQVYKPNTISKVKLGNEAVDETVIHSSLVHLFLWLGISIAAMAMIAFLDRDNFDHFITPLSAVAATINGVGPGFGQVGATENFAFFSPASKWLLSLVMILGRLELYSIMVLFLPGFWIKR